jgi:hypothetical protein
MIPFFPEFHDTGASCGGGWRDQLGRREQSHSTKQSSVDANYHGEILLGGFLIQKIQLEIPALSALARLEHMDEDRVVHMVRRDPVLVSATTHKQINHVFYGYLMGRQEVLRFQGLSRLKLKTPASQTLHSTTAALPKRYTHSTLPKKMVQ